MVHGEVGHLAGEGAEVVVRLLPARAVLEVQQRHVHDRRLRRQVNGQAACLLVLGLRCRTLPVRGKGEAHLCEVLCLKNRSSFGPIVRTLGNTKGAIVPTSPLLPNASLEHLKGQAKLVRDLIRSSDENALAMIDEFHPRITAAALTDETQAGFKLSDAQLIVARMYRCASWAKLREHVAMVDDFTHTPAAERDGYVDFDESFVQLACLNYAENGPSPHDRIARAHEMLSATPALASGSIEAIATVGDHKAVADWTRRSPDAANAVCGPNGWPPLLYATYSRINTSDPDRSAVETVRVLLDAGADPNAGFLWRGLVPPFTALTGAIGNGESGPPVLPDRFVIARLLLEAGADPNDGQGLYNNGIGGSNHDDPRHLELLLEFGLGTQQNGPWYRRLGTQLRDPAELLYDELEAAAIRNRPNHLRLFISVGLDLERPVGRSQNTPVRLAAEHGNQEILDLLHQAGIDTTLTPDEAILGAIRGNNLDQLTELLSTHPELRDSLAEDHPGVIKMVAAGNSAMLQKLTGLGADVSARTGGNGSTALHDAAQANDVPRARMLIEHGANPNLVDRYIGSTPWGWANHFDKRDVADYLYPLTNHDHPPIDITIEAPGRTETVATSMDDLDRILDDIAQKTDRPVLAQLKASGATLSIGIGHPTASIALYLDADGRPWHAVGTPENTTDEELHFAGIGGDFEFFPNAAVTAAATRQAARDFAITPDQRPRTCTWQPDGTGE